MLTYPTVSLSRSELPLPPLSAAATSGRERWFGSDDAETSESYSTVPSFATSVARTSPRSRPRSTEDSLRP